MPGGLRDVLTLSAVKGEEKRRPNGWGLSSYHLGDCWHLQVCRFVRRELSRGLSNIDRWVAGQLTGTSSVGDTKPPTEDLS